MATKYLAFVHVVLNAYAANNKLRLDQAYSLWQRDLLIIDEHNKVHVAHGLTLAELLQAERARVMIGSLR